VFGREWVITRLAELLPGFPRVRLLVGLSGGADSTALLAALAPARSADLRLRAVHVNHGLHPNASKWSAHCRALARRLSVPLRVIATHVDRSGGASLEAAAREARYAVLGRELKPGEFLLTAHHEDDQLETVLLQLFRGAGVAGVAAMPEIAAFSDGWHARPLLTRSRAELVKWVSDEGLDWVEDDTNSDESLDRNYLRRQVLPLIRARWPGVGTSVARSARHAAEAQRLLDTLARGDVSRAACGPDLFVSSLRALSPERRRNALRFWIARAGARLPDTSRLEELAGPLIDARPDANPRVAWGDVEVQRHADLLSLVARAAGEVVRRAASDQGESFAVDWSWRVKPTLGIPEAGGTLELKADPHGPIDLDLLPEHITVRSRSGGERLRPRRGGPRRSLKSLLQESHVPIRDRGRLPLLFSGATLLAAGALWLDESIQATPATVHRGRLLHGTVAAESLLC
jgi:tRNA(Ile)-lysidine synthase